MNKILKYSLISIVSIIIIIIIYILISPRIYHYDCYKSGGRWTMCGSGCGDFCEHPELCPMETMECCDCGPDKCWDGEKCK